MAILETLLGAIDGQTDQAQTAGGQAAYPEIKTALEDLFSPRSGASCLSGQKTGQTITNPIIALIQQIQQTKETETDPKALAERLSLLTEMLSGQKTAQGPSQESGGPIPDTSDAGGAPARGIEQAILLFVARLLEQKGPATDDEGEKEFEGEKGNKEDSIEQPSLNDGIMAQIAAILLLAEKNAGTAELSALPQPGKNNLHEEDDLGNVPNEQSGNAMEMSSQQDSRGSSTPVDVLAFKENTGLNSDEEATQATNNTTSAQSAENVILPSVAQAAVVPPLQKGSNTEDDSEQPTKSTDAGGERQVEPDVRSAGKRDGGQGLSQAVARMGEDGDGTKTAHEYKEERRVVGVAAEKAFAQSFKNASSEENGSVPNIQGQGDDVSQQVKILYSRFHEANEGDQQMMAQGQQTMAQESNGPVKKVSNEVQSILGKNGAVDAVEPGPSSKSKSSTKGEGDSQQLGQGMAEQQFTERATVAGSSGTTSFGDIVADRIARTVEHIAQTNRSDLTLRLKLDGGESVVLEMKERAGTVIIGIQCQDKSLAKALENQKEMMVRNLETKNVSTSISITGIGEDDQEGQRQWKREHHSQQRNNWSGGQTGSHSYFETLI